MPPLLRVWWKGALLLILFMSAGAWFILNTPAHPTGVVARLIVEPASPSPLSPSPSTPPSTPTPTPTVSASPAPVEPSSQPSSPLSKMVSISDRMATTRDDIMARYARFMAARDVVTRDSPNPSWPIGSPVRVIMWLFMSDYNLHQMWGAAKTSYTMLCSDINPMCEGMTSYSLLERFYRFYQPPRFYPSWEAAYTLYRKNSTNPRIHALARTLKTADFNEVATVRRGWNVDPPAVAVVFNGWVSKTGSVLGDDVFAPMWPDTENITSFREQYFPTAPNQTSKDGEWRKVKEVVVLSHTHQGMFWHLMVSEFFRIFTMLPYIQANEDVYIHLGWAYPHVLMDALYEFVNIPKERILFNTKVQADIVYLTQFVDRNDVPSLGMTQIISESLHNHLDVPSDQRLSALAIDEPEKIGLPTEDLTVNILLVVRKVDSWRGRSIANYEVLKQAIVDLALSYPAKLQRLSAQGAAEGSDGPARSGKLNITITEHLPSLKPHEVMKLYSRADIIAGPHGAGFVNLFAARPGTHVVELITSRHLNLLTTSRLGLTYHACVVQNTTREGIHEKAHPAVVHFVADVPFLTGLIESILDSRFLGQ